MDYKNQKDMIGKETAIANNQTLPQSKKGMWETVAKNNPIAAIVVKYAKESEGHLLKNARQYDKWAGVIDEPKANWQKIKATAIENFRSEKAKVEAKKDFLNKQHKPKPMDAAARDRFKDRLIAHEDNINLDVTSFQAAAKSRLGKKPASTTYEALHLGKWTAEELYMVARHLKESGSSDYKKLIDAADSINFEENEGYFHSPSEYLETRESEILYNTPTIDGKGRECLPVIVREGENDTNPIVWQMPLDFEEVVSPAEVLKGFDLK